MFGSHLESVKHDFRDTQTWLRWQVLVRQQPVLLQVLDLFWGWFLLWVRSSCLVLAVTASASLLTRNTFQTTEDVLHYILICCYVAPRRWTLLLWFAAHFLGKCGECLVSGSVWPERQTIKEAVSHAGGRDLLASSTWEDTHTCQQQWVTPRVYNAQRGDSIIHTDSQGQDRLFIMTEERMEEGGWKERKGRERRISEQRMCVCCSSTTARIYLARMWALTPLSLRIWKYFSLHSWYCSFVVLRAGWVVLCTCWWFRFLFRFKQGHIKKLHDRE